MAATKVYLSRNNADRFEEANRRYRERVPSRLSPRSYHSSEDDAAVTDNSRNDS